MRVINNKVKVGARIPHPIYFMFKYMCMAKGVTMESRIEELLARDVKTSFKKAWFTEHMAELEETDPTVFTMLNVIFSGKADFDDESEA